MNKCWTKQTIACLFFLAMISPITAQAVPANLEDTGRHLVPHRWWETAAGIKLVTLKKGRSYAHEISIVPMKASEELDEIKAQGFQVIEIFAPAEGLFAYSGLDTTNFYRIDPEIGTMDDFRQFVRIAHSKGIAVIVFINIGYFSVEAPDWIEACTVKNSEKAKWFIWADSPNAPIPPEHAYFNWPRPEGYERKTWGWQYSELAGRYYWARWRAKDKEGNYIGLPQTNWENDEWLKEAARIVRFWMDTGLDGMIIDAPIYYIGCTWEKNNRYITDVITSYGNTFRQPEGSKDVVWITEGRYSCLQDYGLRLWSNDVIMNAIETGDPRPIEESLRNYHDIVVTAGGILYQKVRNYEDLSKRHLARATLAAIGDLVVYDREAGSPDAEETWILKTKRLHPALHQLSTRRKLVTNADEKYYAFLKTAADKSERILVVLNYQSSPQTIEIDMSGVATSGLLELKYGELITPKSHFKVELPVYGNRFYQSGLAAILLPSLQVELPEYGYRFFQVLPATASTARARPTRQEGATDSSLRHLVPARRWGLKVEED